MYFAAMAWSCACRCGRKLLLAELSCWVGALSGFDTMLMLKAYIGEDRQHWALAAVLYWTGQ